MTIPSVTSAPKTRRTMPSDRLFPNLGFVNARGQLHRSCLPLTFSEEELFFSVPFSPDSPFLVGVSAYVPPL
jgi:hypothetical protein